jgi:hypothetical protein
MRTMRLLAVTLASLSLVATAAAAGPSMQTTTAGTAAAKASLITLADLGKGWAAKPPAGTGIALACKGFEPSAKGIVEIGAAGTESFQASTIGPFVSQTSGVFKTAAQATKLWDRAAQPGLIACIVQNVDAIAAAGQGVKVKIVNKGALTIKKATTRETAYRVTATLTSAKVNYKRTLYFDVVLVAQGSTVSELTFSSLQGPVPAKVEAALGALVAHRVGLPTA